MKVLLITTCVIDPHRLALLSRMLDSVACASIRLPLGCDVHVYILLQNCSNYVPPIRVPQHTKICTVDGIISLSAARNKLLRAAAQDTSFGSDTIVAFPDDDCWYTDELITFISSSFVHNQSQDFVFCRYDADPMHCSTVSKESFKPAIFSSVIRNASSNTIFIRGNVMSKIKEFDEKLGIGTQMGGSEDLDFAIKAFVLSTESFYIDAAVIGHRSKSNEYRGRYYRSSLFVIAKYIRNGSIWEFFRKILVGLYLVFHNQLTLSSYVSALRDGFVEAIRLKKLARGVQHA